MNFESRKKWAYYLSGFGGYLYSLNLVILMKLRGTEELFLLDNINEW